MQKDRVASTSTNAPVIAHLVQDMQLGPHCLKPGTQLNGRTAGHDAIRVFIVFDSIRLAEGAMIAFEDTARHAEGQVGLPGRKQITHHTTNSVALQGAVGSLNALGHNLAGTAGDVAGAGLRGTAVYQKASDADLVASYSALDVPLLLEYWHFTGTDWT
jgi:hypothetical protein